LPSIYCTLQHILCMIFVRADDLEFDFEISRLVTLLGEELKLDLLVTTE